MRSCRAGAWAAGRAVCVRPGAGASRSESRPSTSCAVWRSAISRRAVRFASVKKFSMAFLALSAAYTTPRCKRFCKASAVRSTSTTSSAASTTQSGTVSRTRTPVICHTSSLRLSRCCTLSVVRTSMPAWSNTCTSSHRFSRSEPGTLVCANSSTRQTAGLRRRMASTSISSKTAPRYSTFRRGIISRSAVLAIVSWRP